MSSGQYLATIGNDLCLRIWGEDRTQPPNSGRRFRRIWETQSSTRVPFVSLDIKNINNSWNYLAVIDRQGLLTVYEPSTPDNFADWRDVDQFHVNSPVPGRGEETSFKVRFDQNVNPSAWYNDLTEDRDLLNILVSSLQDVKIYTTAPEGASNRQSRSLIFYEYFRLPVHPTLVRDVQWARFNVRGMDWLATACKDGSIRIFEIETTKVDSRRANGSSTLPQTHPARVQPQSSLTTAIVGKRTLPSETSSTDVASQTSRERSTFPFPFQAVISRTQAIQEAHNDAWALEWDRSGQCLISSGADGTVKAWKKSIMNGEWLLFSSQSAEADADDEGGVDAEHLTSPSG